MRHRRLIASSLALPASILFGAALLAPAAYGSATPPHISAHPTNVMVNQTVTLYGSGFAPNATLTLAECSATHWVVNQNPCLSDNQVAVTTSRTGSFLTTMKAGICPGTATTPPTQRTCYIGAPKPSGLDTIRLVGAARIVVSWP